MSEAEVIIEGDGSPEQTPERTFTQAEVNGIIADRLGRDGVHDAKEIVELLKDFGYEGSPAESKVILRAQAQEAKAQREQQAREQELESLEEQAAQTGTTPALLAKIAALEAKIEGLAAKEEAKTKELQARQELEQRVDKNVSDFVAAYPDLDHDKLAANEKFNKFIKQSNPAMTLVEIYEAYIDLIGDTEKAAIAKVKSNLDRSTASGKSKGTADTGGTYGLTARQQELAKDANIPFKKFAENLALIKK